MIYFTADTHFYHSNIIAFCNRPFINVEQMNNTILFNWNSIINKDDTVYHIGDFGLFGGFPSKGWDIFSKLNGNICLIKGNHDTPNNLLSIKTHFDFVKRGHCIYLEEKKLFLILNHYPKIPERWLRIPHKKERCFILHGHTHQTTHTKHNEFINVGMDIWDFKPVSLLEIFDLISS